MGNTSKHPACHRFATIFSTILARSVSGACGSAWQIALAEPPSETLPVLESPMHYRLSFGEGLRGGCYVAFARTDVLVFCGKGVRAGSAAESPAAGEGDLAGQEPQLEVFLELMQAVAASVSQALEEAHGTVALSVELASALDPLVVDTLELRARGADGAAAVILLCFDPPLLDSLARAAVPAGASAPRSNLDLVMDVELSCTLRFGQRQLSLREILDLASGAVVELDREVDEPVELILDGKVIARGEAVLIDGNYGLRVTQVLQPIVY